VLNDCGADRHLDEHGYAVVDLRSVIDLVPSLREAYSTLHGWVGENFEADLTNTDVDYKRSVSAAVSTALDVPVSSLFVDHEPFLRMFLCKWPGPASDLYLHRDWMYVDEREGHETFVVWIPLQDVGLRDGPLQVLKGSHRYDERLRGTHLNAPWTSHQDVIRPHLEVVPVAVGQAVILNNALVHASLPNLAESGRLVAAVGVRPRGVPLVHFRQNDEGEAERFDIDEHFLIENTPQSLMANPPDLPVSERVDGSQLSVDPEALERLISGDEGSALRKLPTPKDRSVSTTRWSVASAIAGVLAAAAYLWFRRARP